jgi:hypothetical protein
MRTHWNDVNLPIDTPLGANVGDVLAWDGEKWVRRRLAMWQHIMSIVDDNAGTLLDIDTGTMSPAFDIYKIIGELGNHSGSANDVFARVNGVSSSNYNRLDVNASGISSVTGSTVWRLCRPTGTRRGLSFEYTIRGVSFDTGTGVQPVIHGSMSAGSTAQSSMLRGNLDVQVLTVNRIQIFTSANFKGRVRVLGMNINP